MAVRTATAQWDGTLREGNGRMRFGGGAFDGAYSFSSRFEEAPGTNPEELIGAANAGCFSMKFAGDLGQAGYEPRSVSTTARVHLTKSDGGFAITRIELDTEVDVSGIEEAEFQRIAEASKDGCPVSQALSGGPEIVVNARMKG